MSSPGAGSCDGPRAAGPARAEPDRVALVAAVVADALGRLAGTGVREVTFDSHVTDDHLHPVTLTFPPDLPTDPLHVARIS